MPTVAVEGDADPGRRMDRHAPVDRGAVARHGIRERIRTPELLDEPSEDADPNGGDAAEPADAIDGVAQQRIDDSADDRIDDTAGDWISNQS